MDFLQYKKAQAKKQEAARAKRAAQQAADETKSPKKAKVEPRDSSPSRERELADLQRSVADLQADVDIQEHLWVNIRKPERKGSHPSGASFRSR